MPARVPSLTLRELNRAPLARQFLLTRQKIGVVDAVERLACLQGQWAPSPYVALWSRLSGFDRAQLTAPIDRGEIVKATLMRATLHLVSAREYPAYSLATMEGRFGTWPRPRASGSRRSPRRHTSSSYGGISAPSVPRPSPTSPRGAVFASRTSARRSPA